MGHVKLDKVIGLLIREIIALRIESMEQKAHLNTLYRQVLPGVLEEIEKEHSVFESKRQALADKELQNLLSRFDAESDEIADLLKSLFD